MNRRRKALCAQIVLFFVSSVMGAGCGGAAVRSKQAVHKASHLSAIGKTIELKRTTLAGEPINLKTYRGKVVVVTYFTTWCKPCRRLVPRLDRLAYGKKTISGMVFLPISVDQKARTALKAFVDSQRIRGPVLLPKRAEMRRRTPFGRLAGVPTTFIIDRGGRTIETFVGDIPIAYLRRRVQSLMGIKHE